MLASAKALMGPVLMAVMFGGGLVVLLSISTGGIAECFI